MDTPTDRAVPREIRAVTSHMPIGLFNMAQDHTLHSELDRDCERPADVLFNRFDKSPRHIQLSAKSYEHPKYQEHIVCFISHVVAAGS